jgi:hypothetical protein
MSIISFSCADLVGPALGIIFGHVLIGQGGLGWGGLGWGGLGVGGRPVSRVVGFGSVGLVDRGRGRSATRLHHVGRKGTVAQGSAARSPPVRTPSRQVP